MSISPFLKRGILIALGVALLDLWSKYAAFSYLSSYPGSRVVVTPNFNLVMVTNPGISFGMFSGLENGQYILSFMAGVLITILFGWMKKSDNLSRTIALAFIAGGALGNLIDRLANGGVADFIDIHAGGMHWPAFNLADTAIFIGVVHILWVEYRKKAS